jgi:glycosyltransferase involved in cell wall biosynthesis
VSQKVWFAMTNKDVRSAVQPSLDERRRNRLRVALLWPQPRRQVAEACSSNPEACELMDGLSYLCEEGFEVSIVDPWKFPANPLARRDPFYAGIDPLRSAIMLSSLKKWDVAVGIGDTSCRIILQLRKLLKFKNGIVVIDPSLSDEWPKQRFAQKLVLPLADRVVVYGSAQIDYLSREFSLSENMRFLHHRIDTRFFDPRKCSSSKGGYVLTVGNDLARDFPTLVEAARLSDAIFVVHSSLQLGDDLPPNLQVNGDWISHSDLRELYHAADLVALPVLDRQRILHFNLFDA